MRDCLDLSLGTEAQMGNSMMLRHASRYMAFIRKPIMAVSWRRRFWREDDALARLDDCTLRDIGINRCEIRHLTSHGCAIPGSDRDPSGETSDDPLGSQVTRQGAQSQ